MSPAQRIISDFKLVSWVAAGKHHNTLLGQLYWSASFPSGFPPCCGMFREPSYRRPTCISAPCFLIQIKEKWSRVAPCWAGPDFVFHHNFMYFREWVNINISLTMRQIVTSKKSERKREDWKGGRIEVLCQCTIEMNERGALPVRDSDLS